MENPQFDFAVLGAGPGGYVAAIRGAQLGLKTAVIEKDRPGGVCLNCGCIPSKALIHQANLLRGIPALKALGAAVDTTNLDYSRAHRKSRQASDRLAKGVQYLLQKNGVEVIAGEGRLADASTIALADGRTITARAIIIATGSRPRELPGLPFDETVVLSSTGALSLKELPRRILILGAGAIGLELGYVWNAFGAEVTIVEACERILPLESADAAALVRKIFEKRGVKFITGALAHAGARDAEGLTLDLKPAAADNGNGGDIPARVAADAALVAIGRAPNTGGLGLEECGITLERGYVSVGDFCETAVRGVYAIGDVIATPALAHVASKEGEIAAGTWHPSCAARPPAKARGCGRGAVRRLWRPRIASFGLQEEQAQAQNIPHNVFSFPYRGIGKAVASKNGRLCKNRGDAGWRENPWRGDGRRAGDGPHSRAASRAQRGAAGERPGRFYPRAPDGGRGHSGMRARAARPRHPRVAQSARARAQRISAASARHQRAGIFAEAATRRARTARQPPAIAWASRQDAPGDDSAAPFASAGADAPARGRRCPSIRDSRPATGRRASWPCRRDIACKPRRKSPR